MGERIGGKFAAIVLARPPHQESISYYVSLVIYVVTALAQGHLATADEIGYNKNVQSPGSILDIGYWILDIGYLPLATCYLPPATCLLVYLSTCYLLLVLKRFIEIR